MSKRHISVPEHGVQLVGTGPVQLKILQVATDRMLVEMGVDYEKAAVPDRAYYADYCDVQKARTGFSLTFGKLAPGTLRLRTKIEISFPAQMFARQLWGSSRALHETVRKLVRDESTEPLGGIEDTDMVQTFRSNNVFMGVWGEDALMDFYYISPRDMHIVRTRQRGMIALDPVVRVVMSTSLIFEFLEKCKPLAEAVPQEDSTPAEVVG